MMMSQFACPSSPDLFPRCGRVDQIPGQMRKPPKFIRIDEEQYTLQMWPAFRDRLLHILAHPTNLVGFTIEELVRVVYQLCCHRYGQRIFADVLLEVRNYLQQTTNVLVATVPAVSYLDAIVQLHTAYSQSATILCSVLRDVDRVQPASPRAVSNNNRKQIAVSSLEATCLYASSPVGMELQRAFLETVIKDTRVEQQLKSLLVSPPDYIDPTTLMSIAKLLYAFDIKFANLNKQLFSLYIPCLERAGGPEMGEYEARRLLQELQLEVSDDVQCRRGQKRKLSS